MEDNAPKSTGPSESPKVADVPSTHAQVGHDTDEWATFPSDESAPPSVPPVSTRPDVRRTYGRYEVERELGRGSFGVVYLAYDPQLKRRVAIKVPVLVSDDKTASAQYLEEARTAARLDHPNLVRVYDVGEADDGVCYVVLEYIDGPTLAERIASRPLPWHEAVELVAQIAEGVHHAHKQGFVHRDLKPTNILLDHQGHPHVADFGLAMHEDDQRRRCGEYSGTVPYMSPEQARGESHFLDGRSDIWAIGVILYEMLTGRRPFHGARIADTWDEILNREPKPPRQIDERIPREIERVCLKALSKSLKERHTSAIDLAEELRAGIPPSTTNAAGPSNGGQPNGGEANLLRAIWDQLDPQLQDAFALAYNSKQRRGSNRISTRDLFQALVRISDGALGQILAALPTESLPEPVSDEVLETIEIPQGARYVEPVGIRDLNRAIASNDVQLSDCIAESIERFRRIVPKDRSLKQVDIFVDIAKHGHGPSVAQLRDHGVTPDSIDRAVREQGLDVLEGLPAQIAESIDGVSHGRDADFRTSDRRIILAVFVTAFIAIIVATFIVRPGRNSSNPLGKVVASAATAALTIRVWQHNEQRDLAAALPIRSGNDVQIVCEVPNELHPTIFWFDTEAKLHALVPELSDRSATVARYVWPKPGQSNVVSGPAGTELIFVCASPKRPPTLKDLQPIFAGATSWPLIESRALFQMDNVQVQFLGDRGPGVNSRDRPTDLVLREFEQLRKSLVDKYPLVHGVAFPHAGDVSVLVNPGSD